MTEPYHADNLVTVHHGDCLQYLRDMPDNSIDSIVTDPPYGLSNTSPDQVADALKAWIGGDTGAVPAKRGGFMGKDWDSFVPPPAVWTECMRVLKPGGHMLVFAGSRTQDLMGLSIRLAGFELRDSLAWIYGSGFPKSLDVSKAIDKVNGEGGRLHKFTAYMRTTGLTARQLDEATGTRMGSHYLTAASQPAIPTPTLWAKIRPMCGDVPPWVDELVDRIEAEREVVGKSAWTSSANHFVPGEDHTQRVHTDITAPATPEAERWAGWGTALKPAIEPVIVARKPLTGSTVAGNVLEWGTGALNIDASRVAHDRQSADWVAKWSGHNGHPKGMFGGNIGSQFGGSPAGRWPANVLLDPEAAEAMDQQSGHLKPHGWAAKTRKDQESPSSYAMPGIPNKPHYRDEGGASRYFPVFKYQAKAPKKERPVIEREDGTKVQHPTVKPLALMEWLVTLVTPPGGVVLDPFAGSGTTLQAARDKGFRSIGVEAGAEHCELIVARLAKDDGGLFAA